MKPNKINYKYYSLQKCHSAKIKNNFTHLESQIMTHIVLSKHFKKTKHFNTTWLLGHTVLLPNQLKIVLALHSVKDMLSERFLKKIRTSTPLSN